MSRNNNLTELNRQFKVGCLTLFIFFLVLMFFAARDQFWIWIFVIMLFFGIKYSTKKLMEDAENKRLVKLFERLKQNGIEEYIYNFINRFGLEKNKDIRLWQYRTYSFDWDRINDFKEYLIEKEIGISKNKPKDNPGIDDTLFVLSQYIEKKEKKLTRESINITPQKFASLSGSEFEKLLFRLFEKRGYAVQYTGKTGDQGGDLILNKGDKRILIQAKRYGEYNLGNNAIQQAVAAKNHYNCNQAIVITTTDYTEQAADLAKTNNVKIISKHELQESLLKHLGESWS